MRALAATCKKEEKEKGNERASLLNPKVVEKGAPKRKADGKDDCLSKKVSVTLGEKQPRKPLPPKLGHGSGNGLMTTLGTITQGTYRLFMHKG